MRQSAVGATSTLEQRRPCRPRVNYAASSRRSLPTDTASPSPQWVDPLTGLSASKGVEAQGHTAPAAPDQRHHIWTRATRTTSQTPGPTPVARSLATNTARPNDRVPAATERTVLLVHLQRRRQRRSGRTQVQRAKFGEGYTGGRVCLDPTGPPRAHKATSSIVGPASNDQPNQHVLLDGELVLPVSPGPGLVSAHQAVANQRADS